MEIGGKNKQYIELLWKEFVSKASITSIAIGRT